MENDLKEEFEEIMDERSDEFNLETSLYTQKMKAYKFQQTKKVNITKQIYNYFEFTFTYS